MLNYQKILKKPFQYLQFGIEKESLRISNNGESVNTPHPLSNKFKNKHIVVDFSEQQVEFVTGIHKSIDDCLNELKLITNIFYRQMNQDELLWNYSMPPLDISKYVMATGENESTRYRAKLIEKTSIKEQLVSGIHFNWSFNDAIKKEVSQHQLNELYFKIFLNYDRFGFVFKNMFGFSPTRDFKKFDNISYRQKGDGAYNNFKVPENILTYQDYKKYINKLINKGDLINWKNITSIVRTKLGNAKDINWIEIRNVDLDYENEFGVNQDALEFLSHFMLYLSTIQFSKFPSSDTLQNSAAILKDLQTWLLKYNISSPIIGKYIEVFDKNKYLGKPKPNIQKIVNKQKNLRKSYLENEYAIKEINDLELSTQLLIEEAYLKNFEVNITNKKTNKVIINDVEIEMATLNPFDSKKGLEIIDNKIKTNQFLKKHGYSTTSQKTYKNIELAKKSFLKWKNKEIVVKPVTTNFSNGITVFNYVFSRIDFIKALKFAFSFNDEIIIELFEEGMEYRFLVINNKVVGVLKRIPANVVGDGKHTIKELVEIKNNNPVRGVSYHKPLEKIKLGQVEIAFLKAEGFSKNYVPKTKKVIYLRKNSNISTGGDSIDVTKQMHQKYKEIAVEATAKLNLYVCGLDIIIPKINSFGKYTILEMNWNPAIHIHTYPLKGKNRKPAKHMLRLIKEQTKK